MEEMKNMSNRDAVNNALEKGKVSVDTHYILRALLMLGEDIEALREAVYHIDEHVLNERRN